MKKNSGPLLFSIIIVVAIAAAIAIDIEMIEPTSDVKIENGNKTKSLLIATESIEGNFYLLGAGISSIVTQYSDDVSATCISEGSSIENLEKVNKGEADMSFISSCLAHYAYEGQSFFKGYPQKNIRVVAALYPQVVQFIVAQKSGMEKVEDLRGKKVAVGLAGSETERMTRIYLKAYGIDYDEIEPQYYSYSKAIDELQDEKIDCIIINSWVPEKVVAETSAVLDINLLDSDEKKLDEIKEEIPYMEPDIILPKTYNGVDKYVLSGTTAVLLVTRENTDEDIVYAVTKELYENIEKLESIHLLDEMIKSNDWINKISIPLHRGAQRYYKEIGLLQ